MDATSQVIAVTGASRGIGAAIALELARRGFTVGCLSRRGAGVEAGGVPPEIAARFVKLACDVNDEASLKRAFAGLVERTGACHGLVNNAGLHLDARSSEMPVETWDAVMNTNARAVFVACREAYPYLARQGGTIVNIGSFFDKLGVKRNLAYCASKAAVGAITRCLAVEWAAARIRVLDVAPGYIETDLNRASLNAGPLKAFLESRIPVKRTGTPEEVARLVAALLGEDIPFMTGETIYLDGGQGMAH
jgi:NAD(P)-dependent dehydrogenase (short-subunit alcohol dehydrogenase family)